MNVDNACLEIYNIVENITKERFILLKKQLSQFLSLLIVAALVITSLPVNVLAETVTNTNGEGVTIDLSATDESLDEVLSNISGLNALANDANGTSSTAKNPEKVTDSKKDSVEDVIIDAVVEETVEKEDTKEEIKFDLGSAVEAPATDFMYTIEDSTVTITKYIGSATEVVIPAEIEGYPVTSIWSWAFYDCSSLTRITIPDSVTSIGSWAFCSCDSLTRITIPEGVTSIDYRAFDDCESLTSISIPDSVTIIGEGALAWCSSLAKVIIPGSVTSIGDFACDGCSALTSITIPDSVTSIGDCVFRDCSALTSITIPEGLTSIGDSAFY